jgi:hypothetical protein
LRQSPPAANLAGRDFTLLRFRESRDCKRHERLLIDWIEYKLVLVNSMANGDFGRHPDGRPEE